MRRPLVALALSIALSYGILAAQEAAIAAPEASPAPASGLAYNGASFNLGQMFVDYYNSTLLVPVEFQHSFGMIGLDLAVDYRNYYALKTNSFDLLLGPVCYFFGGIEGPFIRFRAGVRVGLSSSASAFVADAAFGWNVVLNMNMRLLVTPEIGCFYNGLSDSLSFAWGIKVGLAF